MKFARLSFIVFLLASCAPASNPIVQPVAATNTFVLPTAVPSETPSLTLSLPTETSTPVSPTETSTPTDIPIVESLKAQVTADLLTCRYGPGPEYLYLFAFRKTTKIELIGQTRGNNWVLVQNSPQKCWVNAKFLDIAGDPKTLKVMYPDGYRLPVSPYYSPPQIDGARREIDHPNMVTAYWHEMRLRAGDEEDENMFIYIIEVWRCEGGQIIFDPLASNYPEVTFVDEAGCSLPSHGRVYFQEKHGYAGPAEIPWPGQ